MKNVQHVNRDLYTGVREIKKSEHPRTSLAEDKKGKSSCSLPQHYERDSCLSLVVMSDRQIHTAESSTCRV
jgi:hypothetical protein